MTPNPKTPTAVRIPQGRVKSYTPTIVPGHHHHTQQYPQYHHHNHGYSKRSSSAGYMDREKPKEVDYFAGAKFDCLPSVASLPNPPSEWIIPVLRSQSQPSSPVTTTGIRIDLNTLLYGKWNFKEAEMDKKEEMRGGEAYMVKAMA